ncbi:MAG TPA: cysteine--tRNA ligase [Candidatus Gracilibacteria bacterium]
MSLLTIRLHNTLSRTKEVFTPIEPGKVSMYCCGPTVYDFAHIGNFRTFVFNDLLVRTLEYAGYEVTKVMNITDVGHLTSDADEGEDKILKKARMEKKDPFAIARFFEEAYVEDEQKLRIKPPAARPRATEWIKQQIIFVEQLIEKGFAYAVNGSVYFRTHKCGHYGKLSGNTLKDLDMGARIELNDEKEDPLDFVVWKAANENHLMQWDSPWGKGFPGWHLECSVMSTEILGERFDIHTGGEDLTFPHHECEIAQNYGCTGLENNINYWLHGRFLLLEGEKMSKSKGNFYTIRDLMEEGWKGTEIRYLLASGYYQSQFNFTRKGLEQARASIARLQEAVRVFSQIAGGNIQPSIFNIQYRERYQAALFDDINTPEALAVVFELVGEGMKRRDEGTLTEEEAAGIVQFLEQDFQAIFDVLDLEGGAIPEAINVLLQQREEARKNKDWAASDSLRDEIKALGYEVLDESGGQSLRKR